MINNDFNFKIIKKDKKSDAKLAILNTPHGKIETPNFIFCATKAAIRVANVKQLKEENTQIILGNTYHLMLSPGVDVLKNAGGFGKFTSWNGPSLTDSGGFQIFSLGHGGIAEEIKAKERPNSNKLLIKINEEGALLRSYVDGKKILLTPEKSIQVQRDIGADIILVLDECTPFNVDKSYTKKSMEMSNRWALRSLGEYNKNKIGSSGKNQALYGISQGGTYSDLRKTSVDFINNTDFFGQAIGGSLGKNKKQMHDVVNFTMEKINKKRPTHLLGIGGIDDIWVGVGAGIDTFDCVSPTRIARHGWALTKEKENNFYIKIKNAKHKLDNSILDKNCNCSTCKEGYTRSYLHHLLKSKEMLLSNLISIHNIHFMNNLMQEIRNSIDTDTYLEKRKEWIGY